MQDEQTNALVLEHLPDIEAAVRYIVDRLEPRLWRAVEEAMKQWSEAAGWKGMFDTDSGNPWIALPEWMIDDDAEAWLVFKAIEQDNATELAAFTAAGVSGSGMVLRFWQSVLGHRSFKKVTAASDDLLTQIRSHGFEYESRTGTLDLPVRLDAATLTAAFTSDDFADALAPLRTALDRIAAARPVFDALVARLREAA